MSNLIEKYGPSWVQNKFHGSYFRYNNMPAKMLEVVGDEVVAQVALRKSGGVERKVIRVPASYFPTSEVFNVPELGYRHAQEGRWLAFISRNNSSYHRGLSASNIRVVESSHTEYLRMNRVPVKSLNDSELCNVIMDPNFIPFHKGIKLMLDGKIMSFAASPTIAVVPDHSGEGLIVRMCSKEIGTVSPDGVLSITAPFAQNYIEETVCKQ